MKIVLLGPPGSGKGTQAENLAEVFNIPIISTGAIIRTAISEKTPVGIMAENYINNGQFVPDDVIIPIVKERIAHEDCKNGYIFDGFPRTVCQAEAIEEMGIKIDVALNLEVDENSLVDRLSGRRECTKCRTPYHIKYNPPKEEGICDICGEKLIRRADDEPETIINRLEVYHKKAEPLKAFYSERGLLTTVYGQEKVEDTTKEVFKSLGVEK